MSMKKLGIAFLLVLALGAIGAASNAQAAASLIYLLGGKELPAGETREFEVDEAEAAFHATWTFNRTGGDLKIECMKMKVESGAYIAGGKPGVSFMTLRWTSCSGTSKGKLCTTIVVESQPLRGELVEIKSSSFVGTEASPASGKKLIVFTLECGGKAEERIVEGSLLAEPSSQCSNILDVGFHGVESAQTVISSKGSEHQVKPTMEGNFVSIGGETPLKLTAGSKWGWC